MQKQKLTKENLGSEFRAAKGFLDFSRYN